MDLAIVLATLGVIAAVYEWAAIRSRKVPTVTELIYRGRWPARIAVAVLACLAIVDHLIFGWVL